ncbi:MAG TPA: putative toxin-antitoxin system toxin component, PIN family [Gemmatimonadaceae bacterium]|nr:putative toxin-antitoxin system toxin component, PIN family [Gemmatimonadaceae bacterium]
MKVALDTNVLVSALGTRGLCADVLRVVLLEHDLIISEPVLSELRKALAKKFRLPADLIRETEELLRARSTVVTERPAAIPASIDADDAVILGSAVAGKADVFVTGDAALLMLGAKAPIPVVSPRQFWVLLRR